MRSKGGCHSSPFHIVISRRAPLPSSAGLPGGADRVTNRRSPGGGFPGVLAKQPGIQEIDRWLLCQCS